MDGTSQAIRGRSARPSLGREPQATGTQTPPKALLNLSVVRAFASEARLVQRRHGALRHLLTDLETQPKIVVKPWDGRANGDARIAFAATRRPRPGDGGQDLRDHELPLAPPLGAQGCVAGQNGEYHTARSRRPAHTPLRACSSRHTCRTGVESANASERPAPSWWAVCHAQARSEAPTRK